jgi:hypothetical protein
VARFEDALVDAAPHVLDEGSEQPPVHSAQREVRIDNQSALRHPVTSVIVGLPFYNVANIVVNRPQQIAVRLIPARAVGEDDHPDACGKELGDWQ